MEPASHARRSFDQVSLPSTFRFRLVRNLLLIGCAVGVAPYVRRYLHDFAHADAFKEMRKDLPKSGPTYLMRLDGVRIKHYSATQLISYAHCDSVELGADRHRFDLDGVHDALYRGKQGQFRYAASHATYIDATSELDAFGKVHVSNKDMDLSTASLHCDGRYKLLHVPGHVRGTLKAGQLDATRIEYDIDKGAYHTGPVRWKGDLTKPFPEFAELEQALDPAQKGQTGSGKKSPPASGNQPPPSEQDDSDKPTVWEIQGDSVDYSGSSTEIATYKKAVATDGDIILIAPTVVHNRATDQIHATGRVQYFSAKADIVADDCVIFRKEKRSVLTGNVLMFVKAKKDQDGKAKVEELPAFQPLAPNQVRGDEPKKLTEEEKKNADELRQGKSIREFPTVVVSDRVEYWYAKGGRHAVITGAPQARQELPKNRWRRIWTNVGYYDGEKETLKMISSKGKDDTRMKNSIGDDVTAEWLLVSTKEDDDSMSGAKFAGSIVSLENDDLAPDKSKTAAPPTAKPPAAGAASPPVSSPNKPGGG